CRSALYLPATLHAPSYTLSLHDALPISARHGCTEPLQILDPVVTRWITDREPSAGRWPRRTAPDRNIRWDHPDASARTRPVPLDLRPTGLPCNHKRGRGRGERYHRAGSASTRHRPELSHRSNRHPPLRARAIAGCQDVWVPVAWPAPEQRPPKYSPGRPRGL